MIQLLVKELPDDLLTIKEAYAEGDGERLAEIIHRMKGGVSYCGTPALKIAIDAYESCLIQYKKEGLEKMVEKDLHEQLLQAIEDVIEVV